MVRRQFEAYLDKVFGFSDLVAAMPEWRTYPLHPWGKYSTPCSWDRPASSQRFNSSC